MNGIFHREINLEHADLAELRRVVEEMQRELRYQLSALSKKNFGEQDLRELGAAILSDKNTSITVKDGKVLIEADEIVLNGDVWINGAPA